MKRKHKHQHSDGEVMELARETATLEQYWIVGNRSEPRKPPKNYNYVEELVHLQIELIKMQECVRHNRLKMCVIFEGRDAAGKGGVIKRITDPLNPRVCRVVALATPTERERGQWYFQRYVAELPSAGEIVLFDRSWYNRAGVERVMGFRTEEEYQEFLRSCPLFEEMRVRSGIILVKYWFSVNDEEQEKRFAMMLMPVRLPPGRARLATRPCLTGSSPPKKTIGVVEVALFAARIAVKLPAAITSTLRPTSSAANAGSRS